MKKNPYIKTVEISFSDWEWISFLNGPMPEHLFRMETISEPSSDWKAFINLPIIGESLSKARNYAGLKFMLAWGIIDINFFSYEGHLEMLRAIWGKRLYPVLRRLATELGYRANLFVTHVQSPEDETPIDEYWDQVSLQWRSDIYSRVEPGSTDSFGNTREALEEAYNTRRMIREAASCLYLDEWHKRLNPALFDSVTDMLSTYHQHD